MISRFRTKYLNIELYNYFQQKNIEFSDFIRTMPFFTTSAVLWFCLSLLLFISVLKKRFNPFPKKKNFIRRILFTTTSIIAAMLFAQIVLKTNELYNQIERPVYYEKQKENFIEDYQNEIYKVEKLLKQMTFISRNYNQDINLRIENIKKIEQKYNENKEDFKDFSKEVVNYFGIKDSENNFFLKDYLGSLYQVKILQKKMKTEIDKSQKSIRQPTIFLNEIKKDYDEIIDKTNDKIALFDREFAKFDKKQHFLNDFRLKMFFSILVFLLLASLIGLVVNSFDYDIILKKSLAIISVLFFLVLFLSFFESSVTKAVCELPDYKVDAKQTDFTKLTSLLSSCKTDSPDSDILKMEKQMELALETLLEFSLSYRSKDEDTLGKAIELYENASTLKMLIDKSSVFSLNLKPILDNLNKIQTFEKYRMKIKNTKKKLRRHFEKLKQQFEKSVKNLKTSSHKDNIECSYILNQLNDFFYKECKLSKKIDNEFLYGFFGSIIFIGAVLLFG